MALLPVGSLALLETPELSTWVMNVALRFARLRTGLKIEASAWNVNPVTMSAKIENVEVLHKDIRVVAPRVQVWISPIALLVGRLQLSDLELKGAELRINRPDFLSKSPFRDEEDDNSNNFLKTGDMGVDLPQVMGKVSEKFFSRLRARNIGFDDVHIQNLKLSIGALVIEDINIVLNNLQAGQMRLEWDIGGLSVSKGVAPIRQFRGTLSLLATSDSRYQLYLGEVSIKLLEDRKELLRLRGAWPGDLTLDLVGEIRDINAWLLQSPWFEKNKLGDPSHGSFELLSNVGVKGSKIENAQLKIKTEDLNLEGAHLNRISGDLAFKFGSGFSYQIKNFDIFLPLVAGVEKSWKNQLQVESFQIESKTFSARVLLQEASLCGILKAATEKECQVGVAFSGPLNVVGQLEPFELRADLDMSVSQGPVMSDPYITAGTETILQLKAGRLTGRFVAFEKSLKIEALQLKWDEKNEVNITGDVVYVPTKVELKAEARDARLDQILYDLVGLRFGGPFNIESDIYYNHALPRPERTRVKAQLKSSDFYFEAQSLGSLAGSLSYENRILSLGPFQLRSGGGSAVVQGSLTPNPDRGPYLGLNAILNRFEFTAFMDENKTSEAFRGFVSGRGSLKGFVDRTRSPENGLLGEIEVRARNFKVFRIPFNEADLKASYRNNDLLISDLTALKDGGTLRLRGLLSPKGGSELIFRSDAIPIRNIEIEPKLSLFEKGRVMIDGFWRPNQGWGVDGSISDASIAGARLGRGTAQLRGDQESFSLKLNFEEWLRLHYRGLYGKDDTLKIDLLEADLTDQGIYAGLAYLGDWKREQPVLTRGNLAFRWRPEEGYFSTRDLRISAPHSDTMVREDVLDVPASQSIEWKDARFVKGHLIWSGPSHLESEASPGDRLLNLKADLPLGLVRLFLPDIDIRQGRARIEAQMPLSPNFATMRAQGSVSNGLLRIPGIASEFTRVNFGFNLQRSQLDILEGSMIAGTGVVSVRGVYRLDFDRPAADLAIGLEKARLVLLGDVPCTVDGTLQLRGERAPYVLSGKVQVTDALYAKEFDSASAELSGELPTEAAIKFEMGVDISGNTKVRNSVVDSQVTGRIRLGGDSLLPLINGDLDLSGGRVLANNVEFKVIEGQVQFLGDREGIPIINLRANTTVRYNATDYKIEMIARGPGTSLSIEFSSEPALSNTDIVSLLAFGVIRTNDEFTEGNDDLLTAAQAEAFQAIFGRAIGKSLSKTTGFDVRLKSAKGAAGKAENIPKVSVMRRLSDRVTARFARSLDIGNPEKDFQVDYRLLNNVNLSGVWESPTPAESSLGVDLRFRFEIE